MLTLLHGSLYYHNKQWHSPETTCMDVLDNNELCSVLIVHSFARYIRVSYPCTCITPV